MVIDRSSNPGLPDEVEAPKRKAFWSLRVNANGWLALIGLAALMLGSLVYLFDRPAETVYLLPQAWSLEQGVHRQWFGALGNYFPAFVHVYAFALLTVAVYPRPAPVTQICVFWWALDSLFELGQHASISTYVATSLPKWFRHIPILDNAANYFLRGAFDPLDLSAIALGGLFAYLTISLIRGKEIDHDKAS